MKILVASDFSQTAVEATRHAASIAQLRGAEITLLEVIKPIPEIYGLHKDPATVEQQQSLLRDSLMKVTKAASDLQGIFEISVKPLIVEGRVITSICEVAEKLSADLIVIGAHGVTGFKEFIIGSNAYGVAQRSACPVLVIPSNSTRTKLTTIMFPVRNNTGGLEKYPSLLNVIGRPDLKLMVFGIFSEGENQTEDLKSKIKNFANQMEQHGTPTKLEIKTIDSDLADEVISRANLLECDLIVITSRRKTSISDFIFGKFAQRIINHSNLATLHIRT
ncbi:universal stress protein [Pedobacter sp.]|uniref:universal stress protein n=1 Tax=Pedobacter sp. TaxID=1411316 RepID=UPI003C6A189F